MSRTILRSLANSNPIMESSPNISLYCAYCDRATTKIETLNRIFNTGFSGCSNDNLGDTSRFTIRPTSLVTIIED